MANLRRLFGPENRTEARHEVELTVAAKTRERDDLELQLLNISVRGFMCRENSTLGRGDLLLLELPVIGRRPAFVTWSFQNRIGGQFERPIPERDLRRLIRVSQQMVSSS